jgi:hypothetical protein
VWLFVPKKQRVDNTRGMGSRSLLRWIDFRPKRILLLKPTLNTRLIEDSYRQSPLRCGGRCDAVLIRPLLYIFQGG